MNNPNANIIISENRNSTINEIQWDNGWEADFLVQF